MSNTLSVTNSSSFLWTTYLNLRSRAAKPAARSDHFASKRRRHPWGDHSWTFGTTATWSRRQPGNGPCDGWPVVFSYSFSINLLIKEIFKLATYKLYTYRIMVSYSCRRSRTLPNSGQFHQFSISILLIIQP